MVDAQTTTNDTPRREQFLERPLPSNTAAERMILGAILLDNALAAQLAEHLRPSDFYSPFHAAVAAVMLDLFERGERVDPILIGEELKRTGRLESYGGVAAIANLTYGLPHFNDILHYCNVVKEKARTRWLIKQANQLVSDLLAEDTEAEKIALRFADVLHSAETRWRGGGLANISEFAELADTLAARYSAFFHNVSTAIPTGFAALDELLTGGGLERKRLIIVAARPSWGKSAFVADILWNAAAAGFRSLLVSLEMSKFQLADRAVSARSGVPRFALRPGISDRDLELAVQAVQELKHLPIAFCDNCFTLNALKQLFAVAQRSARPFDLIAVDYLQLVAHNTRKGSTSDDLGEISRTLKLLAQEYDVPVIAVSQLSRDCEKQKRKPMLSDLRSSGQLEQDADTVIFLYGDDNEKQESMRDVSLLCAKQRDGALFELQMPFDGLHITFRGMNQIYFDKIQWTDSRNC